MILHSEPELHELSNEICEAFVVRSAINDLLIITETEDAYLVFHGFPEALDEEGTEVDDRHGYVEKLRDIEWPLTFVGTSSGTYEAERDAAARLAEKAEVIDWLEAHDGDSPDIRKLYRWGREHFEVIPKRREGEMFPGTLAALDGLIASGSTGRQSQVVEPVDGEL